MTEAVLPDDPELVMRVKKAWVPVLGLPATSR